ncbi:hypothetical protein [Frigoribacterium sp. VKM Ac-2530]|uniref:hypothetical protein n=1 Tax=Frigoribacterium sp. VKM Ac-2530 TaxID=2783822 RepID=UPI00188CDBE2|nr:hypothetical protein [Frigoribacterium sp. VKM Ac-2530]MBF4578939.1 hypothetical protein [Frigoribacterium sp. VKM Ac-2530]
MNGARRILRALSTGVDAASAALELRAHEIRTGITVIDAVAADDVTSQMQAVGLSEIGRRDVRLMALQLAVAGVRLDDLPALIHLHYRSKHIDALTPEERRLHLIPDPTPPLSGDAP